MTDDLNGAAITDTLLDLEDAEIEELAAREQDPRRLCSRAHHGALS